LMKTSTSPATKR